MDQLQLQNNVKAQLRQKLEEYLKGYLMHASEIKEYDDKTVEQIREEYWKLVKDFIPTLGPKGIVMEFKR